MITTVICDLDGLLADTEKHHMKAYQETLLNHGIELSDQEYISHWIRNGLGIADFIKKYRLELDPHQTHSQKMVRYREKVAGQIEPMPGAMTFLGSVHGEKRLAVASNSYRDNVELVLDRLGIADLFEAILTRDDAGRTKPAPDIFIRTAEMLGEPVSSCIVIEDAQKGVEAAYRAGMKCIAVPNAYTAEDDFSRATVVVASLEDVTVDLIDSLN
ncbi:MAG: HAD family phosphatase [Candidatus Zixiibacteriota bacterium]|nr:MAG: HAD family phosphatase [candidate division Zixibacteria bacterium]